jgi:hypothetical protein
MVPSRYEGTTRARIAGGIAGLTSHRQISEQTINFRVKVNRLWKIKYHQNEPLMKYTTRSKSYNFILHRQQ